MCSLTLSVLVDVAGGAAVPRIIQICVRPPGSFIAGRIVRLADYRQFQYILPQVDPNAPASLASTTGKLAGNLATAPFTAA